MEEFEDEPRIGGYDVVFVDGLSRCQTCPICLLAMRSPVQTICGHRFCETCLLETFRGDHDPKICPQDRSPLPEDGGVFRDVAWERQILSLKVKCSNSGRGCDWTGELRYYEEHLVSCKYQDVKCHECKEKMQRRLLQTHTSECPNRMVQCEHCEKMFALCDTKCHEDNDCTRFPVNCPQGCGEEGIPREEVESHVRDDCVMTMVYCPYEGAGCTFYEQRRHLKAHLEELVAEHLSKTWSTLFITKQRLDGLEGVLHDKEEMEHMNSAEISDLREAKNELELENMRLQDDIKRLQDDNKRLWNVIKGQRDNFKELRDEMNDLRDYIKNKDEVDALGRQEKPPKVKSPVHRVYSAVVGKLGRKNTSKHASANVADSEELYDEVCQEMYEELP